jgi:hypothetical protein
MASSAGRQSRRRYLNRVVLSSRPSRLNVRRGNARMKPQKPKILLSEGSSLSSREAITALGLGGHRVELVSSNPICLGRFSRFVTRVHQAPACGADPDDYLAAVIEIVKTTHIDALIPVHEQAYLFAAARKQLPAGLVSRSPISRRSNRSKARPASQAC